jgi:hypothetical protein
MDKRAKATGGVRDFRAYKIDEAVTISRLSRASLYCAAFGLDPPGANFCGPPGWGKSTACKIPSAVWGWDPSENTRLGFGFPWRSKVAALENYAAGCNHTLLFLDEMSQAKQEAIDAIMMLAHGHATARYTELSRQTWSEPLLSNSNKSLLAILLRLEFGFDAAYVDRLPDIPPPTGRACFFEDLHGSRDVAEYEARLRGLADQHHGLAGRHYGKQFERALATDREELQAFIAAAPEEYRQEAADITSDWRDLVRLHSRFATIYASGCLAHRFGVLPLSRAEHLAADLTIARDHVAFVDQEVRRLRVPVSRASAPEAAAMGSARQRIAGAVVPAAAPVPTTTPFDRLRRFINHNNRTKSFLDLRAPRLSQLRFKQQSKPVLGYVAAGEYWIPGDRFEEVAGSARDASALKQELFGRRLIETTQRGRGRNVSYDIKRLLPDGTRPYFVVIRHTAKKP